WLRNRGRRHCLPGVPTCRAIRLGGMLDRDVKGISRRSVIREHVFGHARCLGNHSALHEAGVPVPDGSTALWALVMRITVILRRRGWRLTGPVAVEMLDETALEAPGEIVRKLGGVGVAKVSPGNHGK